MTTLGRLYFSTLYIPTVGWVVSVLQLTSMVPSGIHVQKTVKTLQIEKKKILPIKVSAQCAVAGACVRIPQTDRVVVVTSVDDRSVGRKGYGTDISPV